MPESFFFKDRVSKSFLVGISICDISRLPKEFLDWDTAYEEQSWVSSANREKITKLRYYELPKGKVIILVIFTKQENSISECWTTIRRWTPDKENYYQNLIGQEVKIEVET
jgi:hypothetical protein